MGTSKNAPNDWMIKNGNGKMADSVFAGKGGWYVTHPNGQVELLHGMRGTAEVPPNAPNVLSVTNPAAGEYSIGAGDVLTFIVYWTEPVTVTGTPQIGFNENGVGQNATYDSAQSTANKSVFTYDVAAAGVVDTVVSPIDLNGGTIVANDAVIATLTPVFVDDTVDSTTINGGGTGYAGTETITFDAPSKSNVTATITTTAEDPGALLTVVLEDGGYGYETALGVAVAGGTGGTVDIVAVDGVITEVTLNAGGSGYTGAAGVSLAAPTLTVTTATADLTFTSTAISAVTMTENGYGYDGTEGYTLSAEPIGSDAILTWTVVQPVGVSVVA